jgi:hypothetical protein
MGSVMEPDQEKLARIMELTGTAEEEARVLYHIGQVRHLLSELPQQGEADYPLMTAIAKSFRTIESAIAFRILRRNYPEGYNPVPGDEGT